MRTQTKNEALAVFVVGFNFANPHSTASSEQDVVPYSGGCSESTGYPVNPVGIASQDKLVKIKKNE